VKSEDDLIYDLIFSDKNDFNIDISDYLFDIYKHNEFVNRVKSILKKSKVKILKSAVLLDSKTVICELKVKK
jgi:hypothetical protein